MPAKKHGPVTFNLSDNRYDKPFRYLRDHRAYLVTLQTRTKKQPALYDVVPEQGDRAVPKGLVEQTPDGDTFRTYLYHPAFSADLLKLRPVGDFFTLNEAVAHIMGS